MINYKKIKLDNINNSIIDKLYKDLLNYKWQFLIIEVDNKLKVLTKEKSIFEISSESKFIKNANEDTYYKTIIVNESEDQFYLKKDLELYFTYLNKYKKEMSKTLYGDKYLFGSVAVRTKDNNFITTIRGKENFLEYTIVKKVNHSNHEIDVVGKKSTLNAPLLSKLFENNKVKAIVHINHFYDNNLPYYDYAFPGTINDSMRPNDTSFNISYHGVIYLFDKQGNII